MADTTRANIVGGIQPTIGGLIQEGWDKSLSIANTLPTSSAADADGHEHVIKVSDVVDLTWGNPTGNLASSNDGTWSNASMSEIRYVSLERKAGVRLASKLESEAQVAILQNNIVQAGREAAYQMETYLNAFIQAQALVVPAAQRVTLHRTTSGTPSNSNRMSRAVLFGGTRSLPSQFRSRNGMVLMGPEALLDWDQQQTNSQTTPGEQFGSFRSIGSNMIVENFQAKTQTVQSNGVESVYYLDPSQIHWNFVGPTIEAGVDADMALDQFGGAVEFTVGFKMAFWTPSMTIADISTYNQNATPAQISAADVFDAVNSTNIGFVEQTVNHGYVPA